MAVHKTGIRDIWMVSREYGSLAGAGGVKDVVCQLAEALARWTGRSLQVVLPRYGFMDAGVLGFSELEDPVCPGKKLHLDVTMDEPHRELREQVGFWQKKEQRVTIYLVESERFAWKRDVYTYTQEDEAKIWWQKKSQGHHDYFAMNLLLQKATLELIMALGAVPDVIHCHDGHTAVLPAMARELPGYRVYFRRTPFLVTIHNAGYGYHQEVADIPYAESITGLPTRVVVDCQLEDKFDPLVAAGEYALVNTVSENYARELQETDKDRLTGWLGHELKRRRVELAGVTNGIDPSSFRAENCFTGDDSCRFDPGDEDDTLEGKRVCKEAVLHQLMGDGGLPGVERFGTVDNLAGGPLFTFVGRLSEQKGIDLLTYILPDFLSRHEQAMLLVLGTGAAAMEVPLINLAEDERWRGRICFLRGFHPGLAKRIFAAGDFFLLPSRFEPCGLTDFMAQLFGNIPVVHKVGGLVKVKDEETGIVYEGERPEDLAAAMVRAIVLYEDRQAIRRMQLDGVRLIQARYTWNKVMKKYLELYQRAQDEQVCAGKPSF